LTSLLEQNENCNLKSESETEPVSPYDFGKGQPKADTCSELLLDCIYEEDLHEEQNLRWYELKQDSTLFKITKRAMGIKEVTEKQSFDESEVKYFEEIFFFFVKIILKKLVILNVENNPISGKIPSTVTIVLKYFQYTSIEKKLITGTISFSDYIKPTQEEFSGIKPFKYKLNFNYIPMTHTELVISFAFGWELYLFMYLAIFSSTLISVFVVYIYHKLFYR
jgi:hypothetical protein